MSRLLLPAGAVRVVLPVWRVAVAQTIAGLDFLCVCDKVRIRGRAFSAAEDPLWPTEPLSRGQRKQPLSNSYKGFGLCDGLATNRQSAQSVGFRASHGDSSAFASCSLRNEPRSRTPAVRCRR